jgi:hypothetical protein
MPGRGPFELFDRDEFDSVFVSSLGAAAQVVPVKKGAGVLLRDLDLDGEFGDATISLLLNPVERIVFQRLGLPLPAQPSGW